MIHTRLNKQFMLLWSRSIFQRSGLKEMLLFLREFRNSFLSYDRKFSAISSRVAFQTLLVEECFGFIPENSRKVFFSLLSTYFFSVSCFTFELRWKVKNTFVISAMIIIVMISWERKLSVNFLLNLNWVKLVVEPTKWNGSQGRWAAIGDSRGASE